MLKDNEFQNYKACIGFISENGVIIEKDSILTLLSYDANTKMLEGVYNNTITSITLEDLETFFKIGGPYNDVG